MRHLRPRGIDVDRDEVVAIGEERSHGGHALVGVVGSEHDTQHHGPIVARVTT